MSAPCDVTEAGLDREGFALAFGGGSLPEGLAQRVQDAKSVHRAAVCGAIGFEGTKLLLQTRLLQKLSSAEGYLVRN